MTVSTAGRGCGPAANASAALTIFSIVLTTNVTPKFELKQQNIVDGSQFCYILIMLPYENKRKKMDFLKKTVAG